MLEIRNLVKTFSQKESPVLDDVNYKFNDTGLYYIIGKSGSGKSTLLFILGGLDYNYEGEVIYNNKKLKNLNEEERENYLFSVSSFSFQDYKVDEKKKVINLLYSALDISTLSDLQKEERIDKFLKIVGLSDKKFSCFSNLSGGEKKRISLVRALIRDTPILLIDEPISSLNDKLRKCITDIIIEESKTRLIIVITHEKTYLNKDAFLLQLEGGKLSENSKGNFKGNQAKKIGYFRKKYTGISLLKNIVFTLLSKREYSLLSISSLAIALFTITLSFMLIFNVSSSLISSVSSYMEPNCLVINKKEKEAENIYYSLPEKKELISLKDSLKDTIISIDEFYVTNVDSILNEYQSFSFIFNDKSLYIENLTLSNFIECSKIEELKNEEILFFNKSEMNLDEIIIGIDERKFKALYYLVTGTKVESYSNEAGKELLSIIQKNILSLRLEARILSWKYYLDYSFKVSGFVISKNNFIMSNNFSFNTNFVSNVLGFKERFVGEEKFLDYPALLEKTYGITINPKKKEEFIIKFLNSKYSDLFVIKNFDSQHYFEKNNYETYNRFLIYKEYINKLSLADVKRFIDDNKDKIESIDYSTSAYTYTTSGYISGFTMPFFFSKYKNKLIEIEGEYTFADENLGQMQASSIKVDEDVFKGDILSSIEKKGVSFISFSRNKDKLLLGKKPTKYNQIAVSSAFAKKLNSKMDLSIGMELHTLLLNNIVYSNNKYMNEFSFGKLEITGIFENDDINIYQESLFPFAYLFSHSIIEPSNIKVDEVILRVDLEKYSENYYLDEIKKYGDYVGSFPMAIISREIKKTLSNLTTVFSILSFVSVLISSFLIILNLFLIIEKDKKEIGILLSLGYSKKEIIKFYLSLSLFIGIISYFSSLFISIIAQFTLIDQLSTMLSSFTFSISPYIISFVIGISLSFLTGISCIYKIKGIDVKEAFTKM